MMLQIVTDSGKFGPYTDVQTLEDRYRADGADLPFSVVGQGVVSKWAGPLPVPPAQPSRTRADVLADLASIDMRSIRALREGNTARIAELEAQAVALRAELAAL